MARLKSDAVLLVKLEEAKRLEEEIKRLKNQVRDRHRAQDEQRQKIVGRVVLAELKTQPDAEFAKAVMALLATKLTRVNERLLFPELQDAVGGTPAAEVSDEMRE